MITSRPNKIFCLSLTLLLLLPAVSVSGESAGEVHLDLERALALQGAVFEFGETQGGVDLQSALDAMGCGRSNAISTGPTAGAPIASTTVGVESDSDQPLLGLKETTWMYEAAHEARLERKVRGDRGFGRWLKKYWYVPVLAGAALVTVADDDSDGMDSDG